MGKLTDNKLFYVKTLIDTSDVNLHSYEVDLGLQKLEAAKIESIEFSVPGIAHQLLNIGNNPVLRIAVVNDPDDETTLQMPDGEYDHDVIAQFHAEAAWVQNIFLAEKSSQPFFEYTEDEDIYALRNLRINSQCETVGWRDTTESEVIIGFRREAITRTDLLNIVENI